MRFKQFRSKFNYSGVLLSKKKWLVPSYYCNTTFDLQNFDMSWINQIESFPEVNRIFLSLNHSQLWHEREIFSVFENQIFHQTAKVATWKQLQNQTLLIQQNFPWIVIANYKLNRFITFSLLFTFYIALQ